jgi:arylsulfatase
MLGSRALYSDGWKAVVFHGPPFIVYDGSDTTKAFDEDVWELYHVAQDFSEVKDLAEEEPTKLTELKDRWWREAEKFQVLPLNNQPGRLGDPRHRRHRHEFVGPVGPLPEALAPNLKNRSFVIAAELVPPPGEMLSGVIVAHGGHAGGYVLFVEEGRLQFNYNYVATEITTVIAEVTLPSMPVVVKATFTRTGAGGDLELFYGDVPVGQGHVPRTTPLTYGTPGFAVGFQPAGPVHPTLAGRAGLPPNILRRVIVEASGRDPIRDALLEPRVDLATQ